MPHNHPHTCAPQPPPTSLPENALLKAAARTPQVDPTQAVALAVAETKVAFAGKLVAMLMAQQQGAAGTSFASPGEAGRAAGTPPANPFADFFTQSL